MVRLYQMIEKLSNNLIELEFETDKLDRYIFENMKDLDRLLDGIDALKVQVETLTVSGQSEGVEVLYGSHTSGYTNLEEAYMSIEEAETNIDQALRDLQRAIRYVEKSQGEGQFEGLENADMDLDLLLDR